MLRAFLPRRACRPAAPLQDGNAELPALMAAVDACPPGPGPAPLDWTTSIVSLNGKEPIEPNTSPWLSGDLVFVLVVSNSGATCHAPGSVHRLTIPCRHSAIMARPVAVSMGGFIPPSLPQREMPLRPSSGAGVRQLSQRNDRCSSGPLTRVRRERSSRPVIARRRWRSTMTSRKPSGARCRTLITSLPRLPRPPQHSPRPRPRPPPPPPPPLGRYTSSHDRGR